MPIATDFTRDDCKLNDKRVTYAALHRSYRCASCDGRLDMKWSERNEQYPAGWHVECVGCGSHDFIHARVLERQQTEAVEVLAGLPPEMAKLLQPEQWQPPKRPPGIFSLVQKQEIEL